MADADERRTTLISADTNSITGFGVWMGEKALLLLLLDLPADDEKVKKMGKNGNCEIRRGWQEEVKYLLYRDSFAAKDRNANLSLSLWKWSPFSSLGVFRGG